MDCSSWGKYKEGLSGSNNVSFIKRKQKKLKELLNMVNKNKGDIPKSGKVVEV